MADELKYGGIEIHDFRDPMFSGRTSPFNPDMASSTKRKLINSKKSIVCINSNCNAADTSDENVEKMNSAIAVASNINVPYIKLYVEGGEDAYDKAIEFIGKAIAEGEKHNVIVLVETTGIFADTTRLCDLMNYFASDFIGADWNMYETYFVGGEDSEKTITNLGAYVKLVHLTDAEKAGEHTLIGEGTMPIKDMMNALGSINYNGFISVEWNPEWFKSIDDLEIILTHYESYMETVKDETNKKKYYYKIGRAHV